MRHPPVHPPGLIEVAGRRVEWSEWGQLPWTTLDIHAGPWTCEVCGWAGRPWWARGLAHPPERPGAVAPHGPTWPVWRLVAHRCPGCWDLRVYDIGANFEQFTELPLPDDGTHGRLF